VVLHGVLPLQQGDRGRLLRPAPALSQPQHLCAHQPVEVETVEQNLPELDVFPAIDDNVSTGV